MKAPDIITRNYPPSILLYGLAGAGKTALVSQLSNAYLFDFDRGMRTAATLKDNFFSARQLIEFDEYIDTNPAAPRAYQDALKKLYEFVGLASNKKLPFDAVVIDSLTSLCKYGQLHVQSLGGKNNPSGDPFAKMEIQNYGSLIHVVEKFLTLLRGLSVLTVVVAHVDVEEEPVSGKIGEFRITSKFAKSATRPHALSSLPTYFDEILYADSRRMPQDKSEYRVFGMSPNEVIKARTRSQVGMVIHNEIGMVGLLKQMGYEYGSKQGV